MISPCDCAYVCVEPASSCRRHTCARGQGARQMLQRAASKGAGPESFLMWGSMMVTSFRLEACSSTLPSASLGFPRLPSASFLWRLERVQELICFAEVRGVPREVLLALAEALDFSRPDSLLGRSAVRVLDVQPKNVVGNVVLVKLPPSWTEMGPKSEAPKAQSC